MDEDAIDGLIGGRVTIRLVAWGSVVCIDLDERESKLLTGHGFIEIEDAQHHMAHRSKRYRFR